MTDGTMIYNKMGLGDMSTGMLSFSQELDQIAQEAQNLLAASPEFFQSEPGAAQYQQCQNLINEGIQDGKDVIMRHGDVIDRSSNSFEATDFSVGNNFGSV
jgi:uncharacterized protein YukE